MGAWGPGLFSDDLACDVRSDYREMIEDGVPDDEATRRILEQYEEEAADADEGAVFWLALAFTQSKLGRLNPHVRDRALRAIQRGEGLHMWREDPKLLEKRKAALERVRIQLTGPQPAHRKLRKPTRHVTDLVPGDVLAFGAGGRCTLLRVARLEESRIAVTPILVALDFDGTDPPQGAALQALRDRPELRTGLPGPPRRPWDDTRFCVIYLPKADYRDAGFQRAGHIEPRPGDETLPFRTYMGWKLLATTLEWELGVGRDESR